MEIAFLFTFTLFNALSYDENLLYYGFTCTKAMPNNARINVVIIIVESVTQAKLNLSVVSECLSFFVLSFAYQAFNPCCNVVENLFFVFLSHFYSSNTKFQKKKKI